jgi:hypothetical protein
MVYLYCVSWCLFNLGLRSKKKQEKAEKQRSKEAEKGRKAEKQKAQKQNSGEEKK